MCVGGCLHHYLDPPLSPPSPPQLQAPTRPLPPLILTAASLPAAPLPRGRNGRPDGQRTCTARTPCAAPTPVQPARYVRTPSVRTATVPANASTAAVAGYVRTPHPRTARTAPVRTAQIHYVRTVHVRTAAVRSVRGAAAALRTGRPPAKLRVRHSTGALRWRLSDQGSSGGRPGPGAGIAEGRDEHAPALAPAPASPPVPAPAPSVSDQT
mmetsp:Transcript_11347/g.25244  ORF Transcript_11347/g.25244 Transcript_11347/m.25244 type:complete len:211 (-) Transcript_11347:229-861(-)